MRRNAPQKETENLICELVAKAAQKAIEEAFEWVFVTGNPCTTLEILDKFPGDVLLWRRFVSALAQALEDLDEIRRLELASKLEGFMWVHGPSPLTLSASLGDYEAHDPLTLRPGLRTLLAIMPFTLPETVLYLMQSADRTTALLAMRRAREEHVENLHELGLPAHWKELIVRGLNTVMVRWGKDPRMIEEIRAWNQVLQGVSWSRGAQRGRSQTS